MNNYFRRKNLPRLTPEQAARQGRATKLAIESFAESGDAVAFLNRFDAGLGGRPIDLAVASAPGLVAVEQALAALAPAAERP
jgi:uncharacterized protein (DUF2384 family)